MTEWDLHLKRETFTRESRRKQKILAILQNIPANHKIDDNGHDSGYCRIMCGPVRNSPFILDKARLDTRSYNQLSRASTVLMKSI